MRLHPRSENIFLHCSRRVSALVLFTGWALGSVAGAASIRVSPYHCVVPEGGRLVCEVTWTADSNEWVQVWHSITNGPEQLLTEQFGSGQIALTGVRSPDYHVLSLYAGTNHATLLDWSSVTTQPHPATQFGMNISPAHLGYFTDENFAGKTNLLWREQVHLSSVGGGVFRFMIWPWIGTHLDSNQRTWVFDSDYYEIILNLVTWLRTACATNQIRVIIAFGADTFYQTEWQNAGLDWNYFLQRAAAWESNVVAAVEADPVARRVVFAYDYQNEVVKLPQGKNFDYINYLYDHVPVPRGKRLISFAAKGMIDKYTDYRGGRRYDYVSIHYYPDVPGHQADPPAKMVTYWTDQARSLYQDATLLMGECGYKGGGAFPADEGVHPQTEDTQRAKMRELVETARTKGLACVLSWQFCPFSPGPQPIENFGYNLHQPKDALALFPDVFTRQSNGDAEWVTNGMPIGWAASGTKSTTLTALGPNQITAATGDYCVRVNMATGTASDYFYADGPLTPGAGVGGVPVFVNAFVKSTNSCTLGIREYDGNGAWIRDQYCPNSCTPTAWTNLQHSIGPWVPTLHENARSWKVRVRAGNKGIMDVDTLSSHIRDRAP